MPDPIAEIRRRLDALRIADPVPGHPGVIRMSSQMADLYAADIAWLLAEVDALRERVAILRAEVADLDDRP